MRDAPTTAIRTFVALELDATSVRRVARVADHLRMASGAPSAIWTPPAKMHVTLKFVAALPEALAAPIGTALGTLVENKPAPRLGGMRLTAFPSTTHAQVVVIELTDPEHAVAKLAEQIEGSTAELGVAPEPRGFRPHVTIARLKRPYDGRRWLRPEVTEGVGDCRAVRVVFSRSILTSAGASYLPLASFDFARD